MKIPRSIVNSGLPVLGIATAAMLAACAGTPAVPEGAAQARTRLTQLQSDPDLASRAAVAIEEADLAVRTAEKSRGDKDLTAHRVYMAQRKVDSAQAMAETRFAEDQRAGLSQQRESARLDARTREADAARRQAATAIADSERQKQATDLALSAAAVDAANSRDAAAREGAARAAAEQQAADMQREIAALQAKVTDRGLVLTLGDVLFASGQSTLQAGAGGNLDKLITFLGKYPERAVTIEGHTDSMGTEDANQMLSQRRAEAVKTYLSGRGIDPSRLTASGRGEGTPIASNESAAGRQQNRRVELVIDNPVATATVAR